MANKRKDSKGRILKSGESERSDGTYMFRYTAANGKRMYIYDKTLEGLRERQEELNKTKLDGIRTESSKVTLNDLFSMWERLKKGLKDNTFQNYIYMYNSFVAPDLGRHRITTLKHTDVMRFYNTLADERGLKAATIDNIHTVLHQVLDLAVKDNYLRSNPSDNALRYLKQAHNFDTEKKSALTLEEQELFLNYLSAEHKYNHWYPIFYIMLHTGMRVGEITGLCWENVDLENGFITVDHTLVYYNHKQNGCYFNIHAPKTKAGIRVIPMLDKVKEAFETEQSFQRELEISCTAAIDGYSDFVFLNRFGGVHNQGTLNKALRRIIRDCNEKILAGSNGGEVTLLPRFSCHSLRHTFATRLCESGINIKVIQDVMGHADFGTTMNIYTDVTKDLKKQEFDHLEDYLDKKHDNGDNDGTSEGQ